MRVRQVPIERLELVLPGIRQSSVQGWGALAELLGDTWASSVQRDQVTCCLFRAVCAAAAPLASRELLLAPTATALFQCDQRADAAPALAGSDWGGRG
jgi:hypothetical protein